MSRINDALKILYYKKGSLPNGGLSARDFAKVFWSGNPAWNKRYNIGNGATRGKGMWVSAGSYLNKLERRGLVTKDLTYHALWVITEKGKGVIGA